MICPNCNKEMRLVPAGTSKAGKPYKAFWSCSKECNTTFPYVEPQAQQEIPIIEEGQPLGQEIPKGTTAEQTIMEELIDFRKEVNERLDNMALWLSQHIK